MGMDLNKEDNKHERKGIIRERWKGNSINLWEKNLVLSLGNTTMHSYSISAFD